VQLVPQRPQANTAFGDALAKAFEFAGTLAIFFFIGWGLDIWAGTTPLFMIVCSVFCLVGLTVRYWYTYDAEMRRHEAECKTTRRLPE
jgi:F0F1-type ATP synthase assembly protein I